MMVETILVGVWLASGSAECRMDALDLQRGAETLGMQERSRLSQAEGLCWTEPDRGQAELDSLRYDLTQQSMRAPVTEPWRPAPSSPPPSAFQQSPPAGWR